MKFDVLNRFSGKVQFSAEIECAEDSPLSVKLGLAVKRAIQTKATLHSADLHSADLHSANLRSADLSSADLRSADLRYADLRYADFSSADLRSADLRYADLRYADFSSADLRSADLRQFKADVWMILTQNSHEVAGLLDALKSGRVDGSTYSGTCACLVGTIANVRGVDVDTLEKDSHRPAEQWFLMIREGDKPGDDSGGGFASKMAVEWIEEWLALTGTPVTREAA
ncbi:MAG: pentapeptide repeat-containing protein [Patescibacteria group bacterium]|nr:pentapeptide repeat-containing protein [Patescibacteria group bacterium]